MLIIHSLICFSFDYQLFKVINFQVHFIHVNEIVFSTKLSQFYQIDFYSFQQIIYS
jgi:hypothetical protein